MTKEQGNCPFCNFNEQNIGANLFDGSHFDKDILHELDGMDGEYDYINGKTNTLVINMPDSEMYGRDSTGIDIQYCPMCGRKL